MQDSMKGCCETAKVASEHTLVRQCSKKTKPTILTYTACPHPLPLPQIVLGYTCLRIVGSVLFSLTWPHRHSLALHEIEKYHIIYLSFISSNLHLHGRTGFDSSLYDVNDKNILNYQSIVTLRIK